MIDFHAHILLGMDDGVRSEAEGYRLAEDMVRQGVTAVVATPHWYPGVYEPDREAILAAVSDWQDKLTARGIALRVYPGAEIAMDIGIAEGIRRGRLLTVGDAGRYVLIECPLSMMPRYAERMLFRLVAEGVTPILAHPERCMMLTHQPQMVRGWVASGVLVQITADSLLGDFGREVQKVAMGWLRDGYVHIIASDAHGDRRPCRLRAAVECVAGIVGREAAWAMVTETPERILVKPPPPSPWGTGMPAGR